MSQTEKPEPKRNGRKATALEEEALESLEAITRFLADAHGELQRAIAKVQRAEAALHRWNKDAKKVLGPMRSETDGTHVAVDEAQDLGEAIPIPPVRATR